MSSERKALGMRSNLRVWEQKAKQIFDQFDLNQDGGLNREEMSALIMAVNPSIRFSDSQLSNIMDQVLREYSDFVSPYTGLSFAGFLHSYVDGAGDVDRDFNELSLQLPVSAAGGGNTRLCLGAPPRPRPTRYVPPHKSKRTESV